MLSRKSVDTTRFVSTAGCSCWLQLYQLFRLVAHNSICINCDLYHLQLDLYRLVSLTRLVSTAGFQSRLKTNSIVAFNYLYIILSAKDFLPGRRAKCRRTRVTRAASVTARNSAGRRRRVGPTEAACQWQQRPRPRQPRPLTSH